MRGKAILGGIMFLMAPGLALASGPTLQDRQQAACYDDVMRLCSDAVPDVERVTACMKTRQAEVSAPCAAFYPKGRR